MTAAVRCNSFNSLVFSCYRRRCYRLSAHSAHLAHLVCSLNFISEKKSPAALQYLQDVASNVGWLRGRHLRLWCSPSRRRLPLKTWSVRNLLRQCKQYNRSLSGCIEILTGARNSRYEDTSPSCLQSGRRPVQPLRRIIGRTWAETPSPLCSMTSCCGRG